MNVSLLTRPVIEPWVEARNQYVLDRADDFEQYIRCTLLPQESFDLLYKTSNLVDSLEDYLAYSRQPEYKYRSKSFGYDFFIEAIYRGKFQDQVAEWNKLFRSNRCRETDPLTPMVVIAGLGGSLTAPERVYMIPVKQLKWVSLYPGYKQHYEISPDRGVSEDHLRDVLESVSR